MNVAIVTGSTSGIGRAIATRLHETGFHVVLNGFQTQDAGEAIVAELGERASYVDADVGSSDAAETIVAAAEAAGDVTLLVNNAGIAKRIPHDDLDAADEIWDQIMHVNLRGPWNMARHAKRALAKHRGQIVQIASVAGLSAAGSSVPYAVSKAGVVHLTRLLAKSLGPAIRVNAVAPAYIDTPLTHDWDDLREHVTAHAPARRLGAPTDVADAVVALLGLDYVTGTVIPVDGGLRLL